MHVLKQRIPSGKEEDGHFCGATKTYIAEELSRNCSDSDDPMEFFGEVKFQESVSESGKLWIVGSLGCEPTKRNYGTGGDFPTALKREPVDLTPEEYAAHLAEKAAR